MKLILFTADAWEHVCPVLRIVGPARLAGWPVIHGNEWEGGRMVVYPERVAQADLIVIQRDFPMQSSAYRAVVDAARLAHKKIIYEMDDLLTGLPDVHPDARRYGNVRTPVLAAILEADAVTCSTPVIRDYIQEFNPHAWHLPNYLNDTLWEIQSLPVAPPPTQDRPLVLGYLGARSHQPDLEMVAPVLQQLLERYSGKLILRLWGIAPPPVLAGRRDVEWLDLGMVDYAQFAAYFSRQKLDICIAPLLENPFNHAKSAIKFLEYSALGAPGVYSKVTAYSSVVSHGENGFLASTPDEWESFLVKLIEDPALRQRVSAAARATLCQYWLLSDHVGDWQAVFHAIHQAKPQPQERAGEVRLARLFAGWHTEQVQETRTLQDTIAAREQDIRLLQERVGEKDHLIKIYADQLNAIRGSTGWKMLEAVYSLRLKLAPRRSRRERFMQYAIQSLRVLKNEGVRSLLYKLGWTLKHRSTEVMLGPLAPFPPRQVEVQPGMRLSPPAVSIIIETGSVLRDVNPQEVLDWAQGQTLAAADVVLWDRGTEIAQVLGENHFGWAAPDLDALVAGLRSPYLCMASADLLSQSSAYLEVNLAALESEGLEFTVNTLGRSGWATRLLGEGHLPGSRLLPWLRMVLHKEIAGEGYSLNLERRTARMDGMPSVVGRVIAHDSNETEIGASFPVETGFGPVEAAVQGRVIIARTRPEFGWEAASQVLRAVDTVLPQLPVPDARPTVIMVQPFIAVGGAEQLALHVINHLKDEIRWVVLTPDEPDPGLGSMADTFRQATPWVYCMPDFLAPELRFSFLSYLVERFNPVSLYIANGSPWIYDVLPQIKQRFPHLYTINQVYDYALGFINRYDIELVMNMDAHIGASRKICEAYISHGARPEQVFLVEHGLDASHLNPQDYPAERIASLKEMFGLPREAKVVTFAARLHTQKRPVDFVEMARRMKDDPSVVFLMAGDGSLAGEVDAQIAKAGLTNIVRRGFYRPISDLLAITDVLVLPSEYEGMPLILSEAQIMGKPVVVTDVGNNREVLEITQGGVLVETIGDITVLTNGVRAMLSQPPDPQQIRHALLSHFGIDVIARKYAPVLLGKKRA